MSLELLVDEPSPQEFPEASPQGFETLRDGLTEKPVEATHNDPLRHSIEGTAPTHSDPLRASIEAYEPRKRGMDFSRFEGQSSYIPEERIQEGRGVWGAAAMDSATAQVFRAAGRAGNQIIDGLTSSKVNPEDHPELFAGLTDEEIDFVLGGGGNVYGDMKYRREQLESNKKRDLALKWGGAESFLAQGVVGIAEGIALGFTPLGAIANGTKVAKIAAAANRAGKVSRWSTVPSVVGRNAQSALQSSTLEGMMYQFAPEDRYDAGEFLMNFGLNFALGGIFDSVTVSKAFKNIQPTTIQRYLDGDKDAFSNLHDFSKSIDLKVKTAQGKLDVDNLAKVRKGAEVDPSIKVGSPTTKVETTFVSRLKSALLEGDVKGYQKDVPVGDDFVQGTIESYRTKALSRSQERYTNLVAARRAEFTTASTEEINALTDVIADADSVLSKSTLADLGTVQGIMKEREYAVSRLAEINAKRAEYDNLSDTYKPMKYKNASTRKSKDKLLKRGTAEFTSKPVTVQEAVEFETMMDSYLDELQFDVAHSIAANKDAAIKYAQSGRFNYGQVYNVKNKDFC